MKQPTGFINSQFPTHVCKLKHSLYGLKQAPRAWFQCFSNHLEHLGFVPSQADSSFFVYCHGLVHIYLLIYVNDILITGNNIQCINTLIKDMGTSFSMKDLGPLNYFLGIEVHRSSNGVHLSQSKYIMDLLKWTNMIDCKLVSTPAISGKWLSLYNGKPLSDINEF